MRSLGERLNSLRKLINLRCGPGAAILPPEVSRIHLDFAKRLGNGHMGARKFWRECLPRLKYHNPAVPMIINRHNDNARSPTMTLYLRNQEAPPTAIEPQNQPASSHNNLSKAQPPQADERVVTIDMQNKHSTHILEFLLAEAKATALEPTREEIQEMQSLEELERQATADRSRLDAIRIEKEKKQAMLERARAFSAVSAEA